MKILKDILTYAYRGSGKYILILCVALSLVAELVSIAPLIGTIASILVSAYFCAIYFQLIQSSATGGKEAPDFPDITNFFEDVIWPMLQIFAVGIVSFGPVMEYLLWAGEDGVSSLIASGLLGFGVVYFPMAMLAVVVLGYTGALSPHIVIPAIFRAGWLYWFAVFMLCLLYFAESAIESALSEFFIIEFIVSILVGVYILMTNARILGVLYRERQEELGWL
ncbi:MAG: hypothetical protein EAZ42_04945 [Verrucomicrobia bacterium]|nr:MAG: hypothetical protein EAZ42_04945 [Verrucomicrobiota bacterium]